MRRLWDKISLFGALWIVSYIAGSVMCIATVAQLWGPNWAGSLASFLIIGGTIIFESRARQSAQRQINLHLNDLDSRQKFMNREISRVRSDIDGLKDDMVQTAMNLARESRRADHRSTARTNEEAQLDAEGSEGHEASERGDINSPNKSSNGSANVAAKRGAVATDPLNSPTAPAHHNGLHNGPHNGLIEVMQKSLMRMGMKSQPRQHHGAFIAVEAAANEDQGPQAQPNRKEDGDGTQHSPLRAPKRPEPHSNPNSHPSRAQKYREILMSSPSDHSGRIEDMTIPDYSPAVLSELIFHAVMNDKIEIFAQPIVRLPSRKICYLELFARIRAKAGIYLPARTYRTLAQQDSQLETLDHLLLLHTIDTIRADARRNQSIGYFINIYSGTLKNTDFINNLLEFIRARRDLLPLLVLELQYEDFNTLPPSFLKIMDGLRQLGCQFSLDNITQSTINASKLRSLGIHFIKMNSDHLIDLCSTPYGEMELARFKSRLDECGVRLIVERLETEQAVVNLLDFEIDYGEGYLFGKPDLEVAYRRHI